jgi:hypothetical protein
LRAIDPLGLDCVFLNAAGDGVEEIAPELDRSACTDQGGVYFAGTIDPTTLQFDPNSDFVFANGLDNNAQFACNGTECGQDALDAFNNAIGSLSVGGVNSAPGSFLAFVFSPSVPLYVPNDMPLNPNARIILGTVDKTTRSLANPCTPAVFYALSVGGGLATDLAAGGEALTVANEALAPQLPLVYRLLRNPLVSKAGMLVLKSAEKAGSAIQSGCNAMQK